MNTPDMEHNGPAIRDEAPHSTPKVSKYPEATYEFASRWAVICSQHTLMVVLESFLKLAATAGTSATTSWHVNPFKSENADKSGHDSTLDAAMNDREKTAVIEDLATSGIVHDPVSHGIDAPITPTYVVPSAATVELGKPKAFDPEDPATPESEPSMLSPSEPQAEKKTANNANAKKFFMTCSPFLGHSFPHPERDVKFLFLTPRYPRRKSNFSR